MAPGAAMEPSGCVGPMGTQRGGGGVVSVSSEVGIMARCKDPTY